jgi:hypothetical protein
VRTSPDSHSWQADFFDFDGDRICGECIRTDEDTESDYIEAHRNRNALVNLYIADPGNHGYAQVPDLEYENGLHPGQNDNPGRIVEVLNKNHIDCLFTGDVGQFDVNWVAWVPAESLEDATRILSGANVKLPYDPGTEMAKALRDEHSDYIDVVLRTITPREFASGDWAREEEDSGKPMSIRKIDIDYGQEESDGS